MSDTTTHAMPVDYTLIAGILGEYLVNHPEQHDTITSAIWRVAFDLHYAGTVTYDKFIHVVDNAADGTFFVV